MQVAASARGRGLLLGAGHRRLDRGAALRPEKFWGEEGRFPSPEKSEVTCKLTVEGHLWPISACVHSACCGTNDLNIYKCRSGLIRANGLHKLRVLHETPTLPIPTRRMFCGLHENGVPATYRYISAGSESG